MTGKSVRTAVVIGTIFMTAAAFAAPYSIEQLEVYRQQGIDQVDRERGRQLWYATVDQRSCTTCHGEKPVNVGKHAKTGKAIEPMALSANPERFGDAKKIEKWFLRNCKWTLGRECSTQEKADILAWLASQ